MFASPSAPEVSGASADDSAMEVCETRDSENPGTCSGRRSSASSSALRDYELC